MTEVSASPVFDFFTAAPAAAPTAEELLLPMGSERGSSLRMEVREMSYRSSAQGGRRWRRGEMDCLPRCCYLFLLWKSTSDLSRPRRSGNSRADPAVHVSVPRELWHPLRTGIKETVPVFSHSRGGRAVKHCQQPGCTATGPTICLVLSGSCHPCRGWRDNSRS
jgi:hypothetical protein